MGPVHIGAPSLLGPHVVEWVDDFQTHHHVQCDSARGAELLCKMLQRVLDAETAHCPCPMPQALFWCVRDALAELANFIGEVEQDRHQLRQLVHVAASTWKEAAVMGFACQNGKAAKPFLEALRELVLADQTFPTVVSS